MGKKNLLATTSGDESGSGKNGDKNQKAKSAVGTSMKAVPKQSKRKTAPGTAEKKRATDSRLKAESPAAKRTSPKKAAKKAEPKGMATKPALRDDEKTVFPDSAASGKYGKSSDFSGGVLLIVSGVVAMLVLMVVWASIPHWGKYYLKPVGDDLEISRGLFSPQGKEKIVTLKNTKAPDQHKEVYSQEEAFPVIFAGIINNADILLTLEEIPDLGLIRRTFESARPYAVSKAEKEILRKRLDKIDMIALVYKANILSETGAAADLASARESLERAMLLAYDDAEKDILEQQIAWIDRQPTQMDGE